MEDLVLSFFRGNCRLNIVRGALINVDTIYDTMYNASREVFIMSKWDKLLLRIRNLSKDLRFDELKKVMESYGYIMNVPKGGSSHYTFRKQGC